MDVLKISGKYDWRIYCFFILLITVGLFSFFTVAHPLYIYDTDDWTYISFSRLAWPTVKQFNPAKVLPETLMPISAQIGGSLIMPLTGDYIMSMTYVFAACLVFFIIVYVLQLGKTISAITGSGSNITVMVMGLFLLYHFLPYNHGGERTRYLLQGGSVNCTYNYLIPALLNASLVLYLLRCRDFNYKNMGNEMGECTGKFLKSGIILLLYFLALNSNMFHSIILASFAGSHIIIALTHFIANRNKVALPEFLRDNALWFMIDIAWGIVLLFESRGGRAAKETGSLLSLPVGETLRQFTASIFSMNKGFVFSVVAFIICGTILAIWKRNDTQNSETFENARGYLYSMVMLLISFSITFLYLVLLCAKVSPSYISNSIVEISWIFWFLTAGFLSLAYVLSNASWAVVILPIYLYVVMCEVIVDGGTYVESNTACLPAATVKTLDDNLIRQVVEAEEAGCTDVIVCIPMHSSQEWPMNTSYGGGRIATTLYRHGITQTMMNITLIPSQEINKEFGLR